MSCCEPYVSSGFIGDAKKSFIEAVLRNTGERGRMEEKNIEVEPEQEDPLCSLFGTDSRFVR